MIDCSVDLFVQFWLTGMIYLLSLVKTGPDTSKETGVVEHTANGVRPEPALCTVVLRVWDAWLVGVGKRAPHGLRCLWLVSPHGSLDRLKSLCVISID